MALDEKDDSNDLRPMTARERAYVRLLGNQYASLSVAIREPGEISESLGASAVETPVGHMSATKFISECRRIFRQYCPKLARNRLREPHRAFIERNSGRNSSERYLLVTQLRRYDLSGLVGSLEPQFNRERDDLTETKLREIERAVLGFDK